MKQRLDHIATEREMVREDAAIGEALAPLRQLEPSAELRLANRRALAAALVERERQRLSPRLPLWRRSVTLRIPLIALLAVLALAGAALLVWLLDWWPLDSTPQPMQPSRAAIAIVELERANQV